MTDSPFTVYHLRFTAEVETTIVLDAFKGSALRGAWQSHLRSLYCTETNNADPLHQALCPVCFLLSRETGGGDDRRPYAFQPPLTPQTAFQPGERFSFGISLFGQTAQFLPYLVLAVGQMGQAQGLGKAVHLPLNGQENKAAKRLRPSRGKFRLVSIEEIHPLSGELRTLLAEGETMVQMPALTVSQQQIAARSEQLLAELPASHSAYRLALEFLTPIRIVSDEKLVHRPHFAPLFARLLDRVSALRSQFAAEPPLDRTEKAHLLSLADQVSLVVDETRWWDVAGRSSRLDRPQRLGGFVGRAVYQANSPNIWPLLLSWLLWGQSTQVGKNVVKGCGWYRVASSEWRMVKGEGE